MSGPEVSVVMSVYNRARYSSESIDSILCQEGVDFEFIIVNDGSIDESPQLLNRYAERDPRVRVIHQENRGLTRALIRGCEEARGDFIARQDAGDISLPGRLIKELDLIRADAATVLVSCGTRFVGPNSEFLFDILQSPQEAQQGIATLDAEKLRGPSHHGSTLFRSDAYRSVGGYRQQFRMAQDIDLWVRLAETGQHRVVPELLYKAEYALQGISAGRQDTRMRIAKMIVQGARLRRAGSHETNLLAAVENLTETALHGKPRKGEAAYFIGATLMANASPNARDYLAMALKDHPLHIKAWIRYIQACARRA